MDARRLALLVVTAFALSCGGDTPTEPAGEDECSASGQIAFVRGVLQEWYYWYQQLPSVDSSTFSSPEAYLEAVRHRPADESFSYITSRAASDAFYSESQFIGFGLSYRRTGESELRLTQTFPGSPAAEVGLDRGDTLLTINGRTVAELLQTGEITNAFGPEQEGYSIDLTWRDLAGREHAAHLTKRRVTIPTVSQTAVLRSGPANVGYLHFRNFVQPSVAALDAAFDELRAGGANELVLDLRYNGGGLVSVAQHLAGLIAGPARNGDVFVQFTHNDRQSSRNSSYRFESLPQALAVTRLVVITTRGTASASEAVVNGLRPYMDVKLVGDRTYGKPVGQYGFNFCDKVFYPVAFLVTNARGEADFFGGMPVDCAAADDVDHGLASPAEASLAEALHVVRYGRCSGTAVVAAAEQERQRSRVRELPLDGWRQTLNAW
jgi:C-terminal processing protease CtpA/Prc